MVLASEFTYNIYKFIRFDNILNKVLQKPETVFFLTSIKTMRFGIYMSVIILV